MTPMKKMLPELVGTAGYCLAVAGGYVLWGLGPALLGAGLALIVGGYVAAKVTP